jgi:hypothetical protein
MKVNLGKWIQGRSKILATAGLFALVAVSAGLQNFATQSSKVVALQEGLQTCFTRLHNSYTARLIGSGSEYLMDSFVRNTEECFGEAIRVYENLEVGNGVILEDLNALSTDVSWFHQKATAKSIDGLFDGNPENVILANMGSRFEKLEIKKEEINEALMSEKNRIASQKGMLASLFYLIAAIVPLFIGLDYFRQKSQEDILENGEREAKRLLKDNSNNGTAVRELIVKTLSGLGLRSLARLYEMTTIREATDNQASEKETNSDEAGTPLFVSGKADKETALKIDKAWSEEEIRTPRKPKVKRSSFSLEESISTVVDLVSSKIFTQGIKLDINSEDIQVYGEKESFEQALYNLMNNAIENYNFDDPNKYLSLNVRKLGSTVFMDLFDSGREFSKKFLRQAKGLTSGMVEHTELAIAQSLVEDFDSKISFENVANEDGRQVGRKAQVILEAVSAQEKSIPKRRLARIEKATKKELLKKIQENQKEAN